MNLAKQIKYQPSIELSFLKNIFGNINNGKPIKHEKIIPEYSKILKIRDLIKITLN